MIRCPWLAPITALLLIIGAPGIVQAASARSTEAPAASDTSGKCVANNYPVTGDLSLARVVPSDDAEYPCLLEVNDGFPKRGVFPYYCHGCLGRPAPTSGYTKAPIRLMTLLVSAPVDPQLDPSRAHKTSFFSLSLSAAKELRLAVHSEAGVRRVEVGLLDRQSLQVQALGQAAVDDDGQFQVVLEESRVLPGMRAYVWSGTNRLQVDVPPTAGRGNLDDWSFGLLNERGADNLVKYTLKLRHGQVPAIDEYGSF